MRRTPLSAEGDLVLVIDDEPQLLRFLTAALKSNGYAVITAGRADEGEHLALSHRPAVILLDLGLPDRDGLEVVQSLRTWCEIPIIVISARGKEDDKVAGLEAGANDYLTKPFGTRELMARIRVALRMRAGAPIAETVFEVGEIRVDVERRSVTKRGESIKLTPVGFKLLVALIRHRGKVLTHNQLCREVWGQGSGQHTPTLRVHMNQLRQKLEDHPAIPRYLQTELGVGYRFSEN